MKKFNAILIAVLLVTISVLATVFAACTPREPSAPNKRPDKDVCDHSLTYVAAVKATCTADGNTEYWLCSKCGKYFADGNAANEIDKSDTTVTAHHTLTHKTEQKATCTQDGNIDYFHCSACGENFLDENGKNKVDLDDTVIASKGHVVGEKWEHDENGHWKVCGACGQQVDYHVHNFENYVCKDCGIVDEQNRPLTDEEITEKITTALRDNIQNLLGKSAKVVDYLALDYKFDGQHKIDILVDYLSPKTGKEEEYFSLLEFPITNKFTKENVKNDLCQPTKKNTGESLIHFKKSSDDDRGIEILKKIDPEGDHDHYDFVSVTKSNGATLKNLGMTSEIVTYAISEKGITVTNINAQSGSVIGDCIGNSILNGTRDKNFILNFVKIYAFDNVIYNFNGLL